MILIFYWLIIASCRKMRVKGRGPKGLDRAWDWRGVIGPQYTNYWIYDYEMYRYLSFNIILVEVLLGWCFSPSPFPISRNFFLANFAPSHSHYRFWELSTEWPLIDSRPPVKIFIGRIWFWDWLSEKPLTSTYDTIILLTCYAN